MNYTVIKYFNTANGDGVRTAVFVSGCTLRCKGCFNKEAWSFNSGKMLTDEIINEEILDSIDYPYIDGLSILGGEPMEEDNIDGVYRLLSKFRERFGTTKNVWMWSGHTIEELQKSMKRNAILNMVDYLVDGRFEEDKQDLKLRFRGSTNQRILKREGNKWEVVE